jgi:hypothetical protein
MISILSYWGRGLRIDWRKNVKNVQTMPHVNGSFAPGPIPTLAVPSPAASIFESNGLFRSVFPFKARFSSLLAEAVFSAIVYKMFDIL